MFISLLLSASATEIDFDAVSLSGTTETGIPLVTETTRSICPGQVLGSPAWTECAANMSFDMISDLCKVHPDNLTREVTSLFGKSAVDVYTTESGEKRFHMRGCLYNTVTGGREEAMVFEWDTEHWILHDEPGYYIRSKKGGTLTSFDRKTKSHWSIRDWFRRPHYIEMLYAYILVPLSAPGKWVAHPAKNNQKHINEMIQDKYHMSAPYCADEEDTNCEALPPLYVHALSPTIFLIKTLNKAGINHSVVGIFYRSVTGYVFESPEYK